MQRALLRTVPGDADRLDRNRPERLRADRSELHGIRREDAPPGHPHDGAPAFDHRQGGTMRLGSYPCRIERDSIAYECYQKDLVAERHRHRFEFNNDYRDAFRAKGVRFSGIWPEGNLVEMIELERHPWFVGVQFHPEFKSKPVAPHPLFRGFIKAALEYSKPKAQAAKVTV
ncbi:MAG TPA: hypothetical protein VEN81_10330 [Planctomycetota bacterium]|nr:hypothetical protein [Planctomycetota bacterium]